MSEPTPELSVVAPLHNEEGNVRDLFFAVRAALEPLHRPFEVLLVNDGSTDSTGDLLDQLAAEDARLRPVHLDGNFGEAAALCAGFELARGRIVLTLDGDLQNDPDEFPRLLELLEGGGYRAVSGWRRQRQEEMVRRVIPSRIANWLIARVTGVPSRDNGCGLKAYRSDVVKGVYLPHGLHRFMPAVFGVRASEFAQIEVNDRRRHSGSSHYGLSRFFAVVRDLLVIPYLLHDARAAHRRMSAFLVVALLGFVGGLVLAGAAHGGYGTTLALFSLLLGAYAVCVRGNLDRWLQAQSRKTFRVRETTVPSRTPVRAPTDAATPLGRVRA